MRRLERRKGSKFWEVQVDGRELIVRRGKIGKPGKVERTVLANASAAEAAAHDKYDARRTKGWTETAFEAWTFDENPCEPPTRNSELEAAIHDEPSNPDSWAVYADWLQDQGDPWGEHISRSLARARSDEPERIPAIVARPDASESRGESKTGFETLDAEVRERLYGRNLARLMGRRDFTELPHLDLRHGFIIGATLERGGKFVQHWGSPTLDQVVVALLESPASRFLEQLHLAGDPANDEFVGRAFAQLRRHPEPFASLRSFHVSFVRDEEFRDSRPPIGDIDWLLTRAPRIEHLSLSAPKPHFIRLANPRLRRLRLVLDALDDATSRALAGAELPQCEHLSVEYDWREPATSLQSLLGGKGLPRLQSLQLDAHIASQGDALVELLTGSPVLARLECLDLARVELTDAGVERLLQHAESLARVPELSVGSDLPAAVVERLRELGASPQVVSIQRWRYAHNLMGS